MELFETNEELEAFMPSFAKKDGERWIREDEAIIDDDKQESDYDSDSDYDNAIEFDPSEFEGLSTEDLSPEEEVEFEQLAPVDYSIYKKNKAYRAAQSGSFTENIIKKESGGNYKAFNPAGGGEGAVGKYQFRWTSNKPVIRKFANNANLTKEQFMNSPKLQDAFYEQYWVPNVLAPGVNRIKKKGLSKNYSDDDLYSLIHLNGEKGTIDFLTGKKGDKPYSYNMSNSKYLRWQTGGDFEDLPVYQTFGQTQSPFSWNGSGPYPYTFNKGHINYSPVSQPGVPATYTPMDATKAWSNKNHMSYSNMPAYDQEHYNLETDLMSIPGYKPYETPQISETQSLQLSGLNNDPIPGIGEAGESSPKFGVDDATKLINTATGLLNDVRDWRNIIGKGMQSGLAGATSIFSNLENDRLQRKSLKNMYKESIRDYYKTSFGFK